MDMDPAYIADVIVLNTKRRHGPYHARKAWVKTQVRPLPSLCPELCKPAYSYKLLVKQSVWKLNLNLEC
jgi:hypothetical protein